MTTKLRISPDLTLPTNAVTSTVVIYGGKGMGKTNLASVLVEEFAAARLRFAVIDPMGVWWGLRHSADGKGPGITAVILGGIHGDFPIEPTSGALVADLVVEGDDNVIIDISRRPDGSMWAIAERIRFMTDYAKRLYQRQGEKRKPIHQVIDEAARFAPQVVRAGDMDVAKCMGAVAVIVEEGRNVGIGVTLITQRSARLNKDVAELADCMIAFRIMGPNSMRAVLDWLGEYVEKARIKDISEKLRSLPLGSALVVSPGWLEFEGIAAMRRRETFDSSATPEDGKPIRLPKGPAAKPDIEKYRARLAEVIERAKENDPKALKARIAELEKQQAATQKLLDGKITIAKNEALPVYKPIKADQLKRLEAAVEALDNTNANWITQAIEAAGELKLQLDRATTAGEVAREVATELRAAMNPTPAPPARTVSSFGKEGSSHGAAGPVRSVATAPAERRSQGVTVGETASDDITGPQKRILNALAMLEHIGASPADKTQTALFAFASPKSSSYTNNLGALRTAGLIDYPSPGTISLTDSGRARADTSAAPSTVAEMHSFVRELVEDPQWRIIEELIACYPQPLDKATLAERAGASAASSSYTNNLGRLRTLGLLDYPRQGTVRAEPVLFLERP